MAIKIFSAYLPVNLNNRTAKDVTLCHKPILTKLQEEISNFIGSRTRKNIQWLQTSAATEVRGFTQLTAIVEYEPD